MSVITVKEMYKILEHAYHMCDDFSNEEIKIFELLQELDEDSWYYPDLLKSFFIKYFNLE